ncbi:MAG: hypothetical protein D6746_14765 [Bacteroidetes bacterium]|nr:MAG: hypothetical protein D6746_14765 [Bacteroidota bacterium]
MRDFKARVVYAIHIDMATSRKETIMETSEMKARKAASKVHELAQIRLSKELSVLMDDLSPDELITLSQIATDIHRHMSKSTPPTGNDDATRAIMSVGACLIVCEASKRFVSMTASDDDSEAEE